MNLSQVIFIIAGLLSIAIGVSGKGLNTRRAQRMINLMGEVPYRILTMLIGIALIIVAFTVDLS